MIFPFGNLKHLHTKEKEDYLIAGILRMASSILQGDYLILLRKRECSLKDLALLLMVDGSVTLYFLYVTQLIRNTSFYRHKRGLHERGIQLFSSTIPS
jgi:hypothetical protein